MPHQSSTKEQTADATQTCSKEAKASRAPTDQDPGQESALAVAAALGADVRWVCGRVRARARGRVVRSGSDSHELEQLRGQLATSARIHTDTYKVTHTHIHVHIHSRARARTHTHTHSHPQHPALVSTADHLRFSDTFAAGAGRERAQVDQLPPPSGHARGPCAALRP